MSNINKDDPGFVEGFSGEDITFNPEKCPVCRGINIEAGYGMAGGGMGVYSFCEDCGTVFDKVQTD